MKILIIIFLFFFTSCGIVRVFEDKVPEPIKKNLVHKDTEKQSAYYLSVNAKDENKDAPWDSNVQVDVADGDGFATSTTPNAVYGNRFKKIKQTWYLPTMGQTGY